MGAGKQTVDDLVASVEAELDVVDSAIELINGFGSRLDQAVQDALANGATAEELAPLTTLSTEVTAKKDALAAAIVANTPAA